ncbi:MAG: hydroxyectoine utilization dehydratase EutB [Deltaproteobacteria bacterium]|jgi:threonine dehydratase|nr:hydroxyectoine utilization dehydratase EutB [Deltaproteobacteria bacterium]
MSDKQPTISSRARDISPSLTDVYLARRRIAQTVNRTPLVRSERLSRLAGAEVYLKLETVQPTGTFKVRGAANKLLSLTEAEKNRGVIAFSTGNHGRAVANVARDLGINAVVCLSERVPAFRVQALRDLGAEAVIYGRSQDEAYAKALEIRDSRNLTMVAPFDDPQVICGQGTLALEVFEDLPTTATVLIPLSGGGLFSGVALAAKAINPKVSAIGVSMEVAPAMVRSLEAGRPVEIEEVDSLADALLGGIGLDNRYTFELTKRHIDKAVLVSEDQIGRAMASAFRFERLCLEGSGAVGLAALESGLLGPSGSIPGPIVIVVSGGNVDPDLLVEQIKNYGP